VIKNKNGTATKLSKDSGQHYSGNCLMLCT